MDRLNKATRQDHAKTSAQGIAVDDERSHDAQQLQHWSRGESRLEGLEGCSRHISPPEGNRLEGCSWRGDDAVVVDEAAVEACEAKQAMKSTVGPRCQLGLHGNNFGWIHGHAVLGDEVAKVLHPVLSK